MKSFGPSRRYTKLWGRLASPGRSPVTGVVLAGGAGRRFPGKLWSRGPRGVSLLRHVVSTVKSVVGYVVVVTRGLDPRGERSLDAPILFDDDYACSGCSGPLCAVLTALLAPGNRFLVVSGDYGYLERRTLGALLHLHGGDTASIVWCNGLVETLLTLTTRVTMLAARRACRDWGLKPRPSLLHRLSPILVLLGVDALSVDPSTLVSINKPLDLVSPKPRGLVGCSRRALLLYPPLHGLGGQPTPSELIEEARYWFNHRVYLLALHAARDAVSQGARTAREIERSALERMGLQDLHS